MGPPLEEMVGEIAAKGVIISGSFVQSIDTENKKPEIIHAEKIFVGDPHQREFVISRSERDYELLPPRGKRGGGCGSRRLPPAGVAFARMILMPVEATDTRNAGWRVADFFPVEDSKYLDMVFDQAKQAGRFQDRPPRLGKYWWNAKDPSLPLPVR